MSAELVLGTYRLKDPEILNNVIDFAAAHGITLVDTASLYGNEHIIYPAAAKHGLRVGTKIHQRLLPGETLDLARRMFEMNHQKPVARILMHSPLPLHMWRDLEEAVRKGYTESIGICNVDIKTLQKLVNVAEITPSVVQAELHAFLPNLDATLALVYWCKEHGIRFEAHSVLGGGKPLVRATKETPLSAISHNFGWDPSVTAQHLVKWVRSKAPDAAICIKSCSVDRLKALVGASADEDRRNMIDLTSCIIPFRIYPVQDFNPLLTSIENDGVFNCYSVDAWSCVGNPSDDVVERVAALIKADEVALMSEDRVSTDTLSGIAMHLHGAKAGSGDTNLFTRVAVSLFGDEETGRVIKEVGLPSDPKEIRKMWSLYPSLSSCVSKLNNLLKALRGMIESKIIDAKAGSSCQLVHVKEQGADLNSVPDLVRNPVAMPVDIPSFDELAPFFNWLANLTQQPASDVEFGRGALLAGGHLDMCKQVVGPAYMGKLCEAVKKVAPLGVVQHFLLGNNIAFECADRTFGPGAKEASSLTREQGIESLLEIMKSEYGIKTWYLAGNCINGDVITRFVDILSSNVVCESLWLKRNPLGVAGGKAIGRLLGLNKNLKMLDLHNTGLCDEGIILMNDELQKFRPVDSCLQHFHLGANGITPKSVPALSECLQIFAPKLESLYLDINQIGDDGIAALANGLEKCSHLRRLTLGSNRFSDAGLVTIQKLAMNLENLEMLSIGFYKSTAALGERYDNFTNADPFIDMVRHHPTLKMLKVEKSGLPMSECQRLIDAVQEHGKITLIGRQQIGFLIKDIVVHSEDELKVLRKPTIVDHIFSIYRNDM